MVDLKVLNDKVHTAKSSNYNVTLSPENLHIHGDIYGKTYNWCGKFKIIFQKSKK